MRSALDRGADGVRAVTVYDGDGLAPGHALAGPALVDGSDTTVWVPTAPPRASTRSARLVIDIGVDRGARMSPSGSAGQGQERECMSQVTALDPIDLEVLRSRLEAVGEQAAAAVEHTAITPTVTESKDYSVTLLDADGGLIIGTGVVQFHFGAATHAVRSTIERHGDTIRPGDVFLANDPHNGGGLHPQDVMVQRPIFVDDQLVAWVVDLGAPHGHRRHGGRLVRAGGHRVLPGGLPRPAGAAVPRRRRGVTEVFDLLRNNVRMSQLVEMDLRGLVAGCHFARGAVRGGRRVGGRDRFVESLRAIRDLTEAEMRRRISTLEDGVYRVMSWTEFDDDFYVVPCDAHRRRRSR